MMYFNKITIHSKFFQAFLVLVFLCSYTHSSAQNFQEIIKATANDAEPGDYLGRSVAISGDYAIAGAHWEDTDNRGAAYIFYKDQGGTDNWGEVQKIQASDKEGNDHFGYSVSISGDYVIVGARYEDTGGNNAGAAYVFYKDQGGTDNWGEVKKIMASDQEAGDEFGHSVSISGDYAIVGAYNEDTGGSKAGAAYIFYKDQGGTNNWGEVKKNQAAEVQADDYFGYSVAISGNYAVAGAYGDDSGEIYSGAAYIFQKDVGGINNWGQIKKIKGSDTGNPDSFGQNVAISDDYIIVGAWQKPTVTYEGFAGAAYIFRKDEGGINNWGEVQKIIASDTQEATFFGYSVSISGDYAVVGAWGVDTGGNNTGAAYVFHKDEGGISNWGEIQKIQASDKDINDSFGISVAISGDYAISGAPQEGTSGNWKGAAYLFRLVEIEGDVNYCTSEGNTVLKAHGDWTNYQWSTNETTQTIIATAGVYSLTVTNAMGITGTEQVTVVENPNPSPSIVGALEYCTNNISTTLDAGIGANYLWSNGESTQIIEANEGMYVVTVTNTSACTGTDQVSVTEKPSPNPSIVGELEYCAADNSTTLDAGNWTNYLWSNGETTQIIEASEGTYTVTVTNSNDCTSTDEVTVIENANPSPSISGNLAYCASENSTTLDAGNWTNYLWSNGETTQIIEATAGTYSVTVSNANGCTGMDEVTLIENESPIPSITSDSVYCTSDNPVTLDAGTWTHYLWSNGESTQTIAASEGTYTVTITDTNGCTGTDETVVTFQDDDCDGVANVCDVCNGADDSIDNNNDGIADCSQLLNYNDYDAAWKCKSKKIAVCHNGKTKCISKNALAAHFNHGDFVGPCTSCGSSKTAYNKLVKTMFDMELLPNPAQSSVSIHLHDMESATELTMYNQVGQIVWTGQVEEGQNTVQIDLAAIGLSQGMYLVNAIAGNKQVTKRLMVTE